MVFYLDIYIDPFSWIGFLMFAPAGLLFLGALIFFLLKRKKWAKILLITGGSFLLIALGLCGIGALGLG